MFLPDAVDKGSNITMQNTEVLVKTMLRNNNFVLFGVLEKEKD